MSSLVLIQHRVTASLHVLIIHKIHGQEYHVYDLAQSVLTNEKRGISSS